MVQYQYITCLLEQKLILLVHLTESVWQPGKQQAGSTGRESEGRHEAETEEDKFILEAGGGTDTSLHQPES